MAGGLVISAAGDFSSGRFARLTGHVHVGGGPWWTRFVYHHLPVGPMMVSSSTALYYSITGQTDEVPGSPGGLSSPSQQLPPQ